MNVPEQAATVPVLVAVDGESDGETKALFSSGRRAVVKQIPVARLQEELAILRRDLAALVAAAPAEDEGDLRLSALEVQVEISASGGVHLIGTAEVGATAALTLTFSRG